MKYIVAVSGGADSVVLLDMLVKSGDHNLVVAHFDHGIRPESDADARFVKALAKAYRLPCEIRREELGANAGEATARERRYAFLREIAAKYNATIATAHHADDVIETIAINLTRGTGWRGLAVMDNNEIVRPLLSLKKAQLYKYALKNNLEFVEDETNQTGAYLRNRLRQKLRAMDSDAVIKVRQLRDQQLVLRTSIEREVARYERSNRYFFIMVEPVVALELLRMKTNGRLTAPQLKVCLHAIKTASHGTRKELGDGLVATFTKTHFNIA